MKRLHYFLGIFIICTFTACQTKKSAVSTASFLNYSTECLGVGMDGTQTLRVWNRGRNRADAIEQAKKKAVWDVIFIGMQSSDAECNYVPVVTEPNARTKYSAYFDIFFANGGEYEKYVSVENQKKTSIDKRTNNNFDVYGIVVVVNRSSLKGRLIQDHVIK